MRYIITTVGVETEQMSLLIASVFLLDSSYSPILLCLWHWWVDDSMIYKRKRPQYVISLSRTFNDFSNWALAAFCLHLLQKLCYWSPGYQALSISSLLPHGCWSDIFKAPNWPCHLTTWKPSQESLWPDHVAFIPTQHPFVVYCMPILPA